MEPSPEMEESCAWGLLLPIVLENIGQHLKARDLNNARLSCSHWRQHLSQRVQGLSPLLELDILPCSSVFAQQLQRVSNVFPNLREVLLYAGARPELLDDQLKLTANVWPLSKLEIRYFSTSNTSYPAVRPDIALCTGLKALWIVFGGSVTPSELAIISELPLLEDLKLLSPGHGLVLDKRCLLELVNARELRSLDVELDDRISALEAAEALWQFTRLNFLSSLTLRVSLIQDYEAQMLADSLACVSSIRELRVTGFDSLLGACAMLELAQLRSAYLHEVSHDVAHRYSLSSFVQRAINCRNLACLRGLTLWDLTLAKPSCLYSLTCLTSLQSLELLGAPTALVTQTTTLQCLSQLVLLTRLVIGFAISQPASAEQAEALHPTLTAINAILAACCLLTCLQVHGVHGLGWLTALKAATRLQELAFSLHVESEPLLASQPGLEDAVASCTTEVVHLDELPPSLTSLSITGASVCCAELSQITRLQSLSELLLAHCTVDVSAWLCLCEGLHDLRELELAFITGLDDTALLSLSCLTALTSLRMDGNHCITLDGLVAAACSLRRLRQLYCDYQGDTDEANNTNALTKLSCVHKLHLLHVDEAPTTVRLALESVLKGCSITV